jgi:hypothetical protein
MTWTPPPRPPWVQHVIDGEGGPVYEPATRPLEVDQLLSEACFRAGSDDFGGETFREPLAVFVASLESEADLHLAGRWRVREVILRLLENRLRITDDVRRDPAIADEKIDQPLVVTGSPRAGTSTLHQLLALDPAARAPMAWEFWCPSPPPDPETFEDDPRIPLADRDVRLSAALAPSWDGMHEQGARIPRECMSAMAHDFRSDVLVAHYPTPSYRTWFQRDDLLPGYAWHRLVLQVLQRRFEPRRWVLKSPGHMAKLPSLLHTYPDANVVVCHRDPVEMLSSVTSVIATLRWAHSNFVDYAAVAREQADFYADVLTRLTEYRRSGGLDPSRVCDVHFDAFNADPVGVVRGVYEHFRLPFDDALAARITAHLDAKPKGRLGGHAHSWDDLGLDVAAERARFAAYVEYFGVRSEDV